MGGDGLGGGRFPRRYADRSFAPALYGIATLPPVPCTSRPGFWFAVVPYPKYLSQKRSIIKTTRRLFVYIRLRFRRCSWTLSLAPALTLALVRSSHGLMDVRVPPRAPELIGSWMLNGITGASDATASIAAARVGRVLENEVFVVAAAAAVSAAATRPAASTAPSSSSSPAPISGDDERALVRLPPARAGGVLEVSLGAPPAPTLGDGRELWGFSLRVDPLFPSELCGAHPWIARQFKTFADLVWGRGEEGAAAHASNSELVRCGWIDGWMDGYVQVLLFAPMMVSFFFPAVRCSSDPPFGFLVCQPWGR